MTGVPLVSVITPHFNSGGKLRVAIESVLRQSMEDFEHLIVDDGSTDKSLEELEDLINSDSRIKLIRLGENRGQAYARRFAIEHSKGDWISFLDSDDFWLKEKLQTQLKVCGKDDVFFCGSAFFHWKLDTGTVHIRQHSSQSIHYNSLKFHNYIGCLTAIVSGEVARRLDYPVVNKRDDWAFWLRVSKQCRGVCLDEPLAVYCDHGEGISSNKFEMLFRGSQMLRKENVAKSWPEALVLACTHSTISFFARRKCKVFLSSKNITIETFESLSHNQR